MEQKRLFIGIPITLSLTTEKKLRSLRNKNFPERINWIPLQNYHITLKFLGERPIEKIPIYKNLLEELNYHFSTFKIEPGSVARISKRYQSIIWVNMAPIEKLRVIKEAIDSILDFDQRMKNSLPFRPHLTIAKCKSLSQGSFKEITGHLSGFDIHPRHSTKIALYQSTLTPNGSVYEILEECELS